MMLWLFDTHATKVYAQARKNNPYWNDYDEISIQMELTNGMTATLNHSLNCVSGAWDTHITGTENSMYITNDDFGRPVELEDEDENTLKIAYQGSTVTKLVSSMQLSSGDDSYNEEQVNITCDGLNRATSVIINGTEESISYPNEPGGKQA